MAKFLLSGLIVFSTLTLASDWLWDSLITRYNFDNSKQAYCHRNSVGRITGENVDLKVRPASVTKLYMTLWALDKLGKDYRFETKFHIYEDHLHIEGRLDPFFTTENLYYILSSLNDMGIDELHSVSFSEDFFFNWTDDVSKIADLLKGYLNTDSWNEAHKLEFENLHLFNVSLGLNLPLRNDLRFKVDEIKPGSKPQGDPLMTGTFKSSPITQHLKQMNIYSTNFIAMKFFDLLGGEPAFARYIKEKFKVSEDTIYFQNGAGFEPNVTTCRLTILVLERLKFFISSQNLNLQDIISVPGEDLGTLKDRYQNHLAKTLVAKTGTLSHTSTLSGYLNTNNGELPFAIFNHTLKTANARNMQDEFVAHLFSKMGSPQSYMYYRSDYIPLVESNLNFQ